jgi:exopolysaccharide biosynthesis protein
MRNVNIAAALVTFFACAAVGRAEWKIANSTSEASPNDAVVHWQTVIEDPTTDERATLHLAVFVTHEVRLRVIDQPDRPRHGLAEVMGQERCVAGVNGGYFDPQNAPVGLLVSDGQLISPPRKARLLTGVLLATANRVDVVRAARFSMSNKIASAVQCGPLLVERSAPVAGLDDTRPARRTFAAVDGSGHAALGVCSSVSLAQLGKILCLTKMAGNIKIMRALNLDGGSSSAFWFAGRQGAFSIPEEKIVRDFVAIVAR